MTYTLDHAGLSSQSVIAHEDFCGIVSGSGFIRNSNRNSKRNSNSNSSSNSNCNGNSNSNWTSNSTYW